MAKKNHHLGDDVHVCSEIEAKMSAGNDMAPGNHLSDQGPLVVDRVYRG